MDDYRISKKFLRPRWYNVETIHKGREGAQPTFETAEDTVFEH